MPKKTFEIESQEQKRHTANGWRFSAFRRFFALCRYRAGSAPENPFPGWNFHRNLIRILFLAPCAGPPLAEILVRSQGFCQRQKSRVAAPGSKTASAATLPASPLLCTLGSAPSRSDPEPPRVTLSPGRAGRLRSRERNTRKYVELVRLGADIYLNGNRQLGRLSR